MTHSVDIPIKPYIYKSTFLTSHFRTELCLFVASLSSNARVSPLNIVPK